MTCIGRGQGAGRNSVGFQEPDGLNNGCGDLSHCGTISAHAAMAREKIRRRIMVGFHKVDCSGYLRSPCHGGNRKASSAAGFEMVAMPGFEPGQISVLTLGVTPILLL